jgi:anaerobic C4-dicarboxylate transporter
VAVVLLTLTWPSAFSLEGNTRFRSSSLVAHHFIGIGWNGDSEVILIRTKQLQKKTVNMLMKRSLLFVFVVLVVCVCITVKAVTLKEKLTAIESETNKALKAIFDRWDISHYPNFLRSASMSHSSWEVLKVTNNF